ncbi:hypothetical protein PG5_46580 [Pseudomonas sp. G5(2012)]|nr:hypothetical protein PG5_46580 [Pseudomonas sp. G5(2012)]
MAVLGQADRLAHGGTSWDQWGRFYQSRHCPSGRRLPECADDMHRRTIRMNFPSAQRSLYVQQGGTKAL